MKIAELIEYVAIEAGLERSAAKKAIEAVFTGIVGAATKGEEVDFPGFGKFKVKDNAARQSRNPVTGEAIEIAAWRKLGFLPAKQVKDALAGSATGLILTQSGDPSEHSLHLLRSHHGAKTRNRPEMPLYLFRSCRSRGIFAFTPNMTASNLPATFAPWEPPGGSLIQVASDTISGAARDAVEADGYYIGSADSGRVT